jgi:exodeoxyribonuclease V alpha subunit
VYSTGLLENIVLAYAITVHKSQGSEFDYVVVTLYGGSERLYYRNLLYTAVTRAKKMLIVVGSTALFNKMIRSSNRNTRITALKPMIQELAGEDDDTEL